MKDQMDRLESKIDKTIEVVTDINLNVAKLEIYVEQNTQDLAEHIEGVQQTRVRLDRLERIDQWIRGAAWMLAGLVAGIYTVAKLLK